MQSSPHSDTSRPQATARNTRPQKYHQAVRRSHAVAWDMDWLRGGETTREIAKRAQAVDANTAKAARGRLSAPATAPFPSCSQPRRSSVPPSRACSFNLFLFAFCLYFSLSSCLSFTGPRLPTSAFLSSVFSPVHAGVSHSNPPLKTWTPRPLARSLRSLPRCPHANDALPRLFASTRPPRLSLSRPCSQTTLLPPPLSPLRPQTQIPSSFRPRADTVPAT